MRWKKYKFENGINYNWFDSHSKSKEPISSKIYSKYTIRKYSSVCKFNYPMYTNINGITLWLRGYQQYLDKSLLHGFVKARLGGGEKSIDVFKSSCH